ncbi:MAG: hypothetical protein JXQ71_15230 [Verrucomicrobia bacterium]|nr:hypothetical protein [Verrucomicrobiota bacterium]
MKTFVFLVCIGGVTALGAAETPLTLDEPSPPGILLWEIGKADNSTREFALAPNRYSQFREDGLFVVGRSEAARDWPYAHPGPADAWAGSRPHTFAVCFGVRRPPPEGDCVLHIDLVDTHRQSPPSLRIALNGRALQYRMPPGAGDDSVFGQPEKGREHKFQFKFPADALLAGLNEIAITTVSGSWVLYDWMGLEAPEGVELGEASGTLVGGMVSAPVLVQREGRLMQLVQATVRHFGPDAPATVLFGGLGATNLVLREGRHTIDLAVPAVTNEVALTVTVSASGKVLAERPLRLKPVRRWVVYLLPHSHVDIGYTHVQTEVERAQWKYLEMAMDIARQTAANPPGARFKWNVEVLWAVDGYLKQATPDQRRAFFEAVRAGQVGLDALYGNMLTGLCSQEELLRLLRCGLQLSRESGVPVESAMITDVPGYTWGIVPALAHAGVKYFSIGPNGGDRIGHTSRAWGDKPFWWIGPNGTDKVLAWMTGTGYYRVFSSPDNLQQYLERLQARGYPYDFVQVRHCLGDNGAPDVHFADTVKQWNEKYAYPKLVIATTAEMFHDFERRYGDQLPRIRGDFTPYWEDGAASSALETAMNRASADRLLQAETLYALFHPRAYPAGDFNRAWRNVLLYDEHTWGAYNSISEPDHPFVKSQWTIKRQFALDADRESRELIARASLARGGPAPAAPAAPNPGTPAAQAIDVVNTSGFDDPAALVTVPPELSSAGDRVRRHGAGEAGVVSQRLTTGELVFHADAYPYHTLRYEVGPGPAAPAPFEGATAAGNRLATANSALAPGLSLRVDEQTGAISSLMFDGHELVDPKSHTALNDYFYLPASDLKGLQQNGPVTITVRERGPLVASLQIESAAPGCRKLVREIRMHALRPCVEIINTVDKLPVRAKEGVHFGFGFNVPGGVVRLDVPWGVVRPEADQIPGACRNWFTVQRWVDISSQDYGLTWVTPEAPLVQVGRITANLIGGLAGSPLWLEHIEPSTTLYSWAMNNHWHTNYRAEQEGPTVFRYFIFPHRSGYSRARATRCAATCTQPLLVLPARGDLPTPPLAVDGRHGPAGLQITAFKPSDDGKARIVRILNLADRADLAELAWAGPQPKAVFLSDASEQPRTRVEGPVDVPPQSIVTLRAELP